MKVALSWKGRQRHHANAFKLDAATKQYRLRDGRIGTCIFSRILRHAHLQLEARNANSSACIWSGRDGPTCLACTKEDAAVLFRSADYRR